MANDGTNTAPGPSVPPTQAAAQAQLEEIKGGSDPTLVADYLAGKSYAKSRIDKLERVSLGVKPVVEEDFRLRDVSPELRADFLQGKPAAKAEIDRLLQERIAARNVSTAPTQALRPTCS